MKKESTHHSWKLAIVLICSQLFLSCSNDIRSDWIGTLDLTTKREEADIPLSSIGVSVDYIALESTPESFISVRRQIKISENYILVADKQLNRILLFNKEGKFLRRIGKLGKGPGEFPEVYSVEFVENEDRIYVRVPGNDIILFDIQGTYLGTIEKVGYPNSLKVKDGFLYQYYLYNTVPATEGYSLIAHDLKTDEKIKILFRKILDKMPSMGGSMSQYIYKDTLCYWESVFDTIYGITIKNEVFPRWVVKADNKIGMDTYMNGPDQLNEDMLSGKMMLQSIKETESHFFISMIEKVALKHLVYNKESNQLTEVIGSQRLDEVFAGFKNDLDMGPDFWPIGTINENQLTSIVDAEKIISFRKKLDDNDLNKLNSDLKDLISSINENSNPIIMIVTQK